MDYFENRTLLIATKHQKERVIAPLFTSNFHVHCQVCPIDTDQFGTFSGEIERQNTPEETLRLKCDAAIAEMGHDLCVASEGSFGPHPLLHLINADIETVMLLDKKNKFEISATEISTQTNLNGAELNTMEALETFATTAGFPSHGLILRKSRTSNEDIVKGIVSYQELLSAFERLLADYQRVYVETDMRAMYNPTRMKLIEKTTAKLINLLKSPCPHCKHPGYDVYEKQKGLPCNNCGFPTRSAMAHLMKCKWCNHEDIIYFPNQITHEDPMYCDRCNP